MKKKIFFSFLAAMVFMFPLQQLYQENQAHAFYSKVASKVGKEMLKEVIIDATINQAANMAVLEAQDIADKYAQKADYATICMDRMKGATTCEKPMQIKKNLTETDKSNLKNQVGVSLDNKIAGGINATRWARFLDWLAPVFLVTTAAYMLDYAFNDGDIKDLLDEVGYDALIALGLLTPATPKETDENGNLVPTEETTTIALDGTTSTIKMQTIYAPYGTGQTLKFTRQSSAEKPDRFPVGFTGQTFVAEVVKTDGHYAERNVNFNFGTMKYGTQNPLGVPMYNNTSIDKIKFWGDGSTGQSTLWKNDIEIFTSLSGGVPEKTYAELGMTESFVYRQMFNIISPGHFVITSWFVDGTKLKYDWKINVPAATPDYNWMYGTIAAMASVTNSTTFGQDDTNLILKSYPKGVPVVLEPLTPTPEELIPYDAPTTHSDYVTPEKIQFRAPNTFTYTDSVTGEPLTPGQAEDGTTIFKSPNGTPVPDANINVGEGDYTKNPDKTVTYTPTPTEENPEPVQVTVPLVPPPPPPPPVEEPPLSEIPEGEYCAAKLQFPIFSPLQNVFTTSFPFSIPWDIGRAIEAAFGDIGTEKPEFEIVINTAGINETFVITTPALFDDWKPFTDSFLVFTFDVLIMFGIFRFVKGAGS